MSEFKKEEELIRQVLLKVMPGRKRAGKWQLNDHTSWGTLQYGTLRLAHKIEFSDVISEIHQSMFDLVEPLMKASEKEKYGPLYAMNITVKNQTIDFEYHWKNDPALNVKNVLRDHHGNVPAFMFVRKFDQELLESVDDSEVFYCLEDVIYHAIQKEIPLHSDLIDYYAVYDWVTDCRNGGWNQYFGRVTDGWDTGHFSRKEMYRRVLSACRKFENQAALELFKESLGLFANVHDFVEEARVELEISKQPDKEESDIFDRFYEIDSEVEQNTAILIRNGISDYSIDFTKYP